MLDNHLYNLLRQLVEEHTSLWRIRNEYLNDSEECDSCREFWRKLEQDKENTISELVELVKKHMEVK